MHGLLVSVGGHLLEVVEDSVLGDLLYMVGGGHEGRSLVPLAAVVAGQLVSWTATILLIKTLLMIRKSAINLMMTVKT